MMNPAKLFKMKGAWDSFTKNHPKFPMFVNAVKANGIHEGTIMEISMTTPEGKTLSTNIKVTQTDRELFEELESMMRG